MFYAQRDNGWNIDYAKIYEHFGRDKEVYTAYYFTGIPPDTDVEARRRYKNFRRFLINSRYTVVDKEIKIIRDRKTGEEKRKANLDVEITLNVMASMSGFNEAIFLSGDSDFAALLTHLRNSGKKIVCVARRQSTALEVRNIAHEFIDLNEIRSEIEKQEERR